MTKPRHEQRLLPESFVLHRAVGKDYLLHLWENDAAQQAELRATMLVAIEKLEAEKQ